MEGPSVELEAMKQHYREQLVEHQDTARACSWKSEDVANRNFSAVAQVFLRNEEPFSVYEIGSGVGAMAEFLRAHVPLARYSGCDILPEMIERAKARDSTLDVEVRNVLTDPPTRQYDYVLISGLFNLRMENDPELWQRFVEQMLLAAFKIAKKGIASNFLTGHVEWTRELGYYQNPAKILDYAICNLSRFCDIRHSYYPWEFTLCVYREPVAIPFAPAFPWPPEQTNQPDGRAF